MQTTTAKPSAKKRPVLKGAKAAHPTIDLERYMGDWHVIANIPTPPERGAHNAVEGYRLNPDGSIFNFYECRKGSFEGKKRRFTARAWVTNPKTRAEWKVQFFWPVKFAYEILEVAPDYSYTVVSHPSKRYVWIMAREPQMDESLLDAIYVRLARLGFNTDKIERVPQSGARGGDGLH